MNEVTSKIFLYLIIVFSAIIHEYSHAFVANELGDDTAKKMGRLTLNPIRHIDIMGTVFVPLFLLFTSGIFIGWAKPVPFDPFKLKSPKDELKIALAGPASNLAIAIIMSGLFFLMTMFANNLAIMISPFVALIIQINISLALFNLIPAPPLDGSRIISVILPFEWARKFERMGIIGIVIALWVGMAIVPYITSWIFFIITGFGHLFG